MTKCYCDRCRREMRPNTGFFIAINDKATKNEGKAHKASDVRKCKFDICEQCRDELGEFLMGTDLSYIDF